MSTSPNSVNSRVIALEEISSNDLDHLYESFESAHKDKQYDVEKSIQKKIFEIRTFPFDQEIQFSKNSNLFLFEWKISKITSEEDLIKLRDGYIDPKYKKVVSKRLTDLKK